MKNRGSKFVAVVLVLAAFALMVVSIIERGSGQFWMPWLHLVAWALLMIGVAVFTYVPEEAADARSLYGDLRVEEKSRKAV